MGTSSAFGGQGNNTPLVPTWLEPDAMPVPQPPQEPPGENGTDPQTPANPDTPAQPYQQPAPPPEPNRFTPARTNFSRFVASGGSDRASLGRAVAHYVAHSVGGSRRATQRMGASRAAGRRLLGFLSDAVKRGAREALRVLNLEALAGHPIEDIFLGMSDYVCQDGGTIDQAIVRDAFIETIAELAESGITDLDGLTIDQMRTVFELYATHSIEARLYNDIGTQVIVLPTDLRAIDRVQAQIHDFIRRSVADALNNARDRLETLTDENVRSLVDGVYEQAFSILQRLGESEAEA